MEAMTQEFMLHRRPHAEIWSAREGSDDDTSKIHRRHKTSDGSKTMSTKNTDPPQKSDGSQQTMVNLRYHKTETKKNQTINHYRVTPQKSNLTELNLTTCPFESTSETPDAASVTNGWQHLTHIWRPSRHVPNTGVLPWIRLHILSGIGGYAKSSLQGFSVDNSHVAEMANHNKMIIASTETGVDIRLASTSITNPHCKGQLSFGQTQWFCES